jgi:hypothetical protein
MHSAETIMKGNSMGKKSMLLVLSAVCAAMFVVPSVASAGEWTMEPPRSFKTSSNTVTTLTTSENETTECTSSSGNGTTNPAGTGGTISLLFHGCTSSGTACTTSGQNPGTIVSTTVNWKSVYLTKDKSDPGIKIEGANHGHIATFKCAFGFVTIVVNGSVIGDIEQKCNEPKSTFTVDFQSTAHGTQKYMQNTLTGEKTDLKVFRNGVERTGSQDGTGFINLEGGESKIHCA